MSIGPDWNLQFNFQKPTASTIAAIAERHLFNTQQTIILNINEIQTVSIVELKRFVRNLIKLARFQATVPFIFPIFTITSTGS